MEKSRYLVFVITLFVASAFFIVAKTEAGSVWLMIDEPPSSAESGGVFETTLKFTTWNAVNGAYVVKLHYDPALLQILQVTVPSQSEFYGKTFVDTNSFTSGKTDIAAFQVSNSSEQTTPATLATIQWMALGKAGTLASIQTEAKAVIDFSWRPVDVDDVNNAYPVTINIIGSTPPTGEVAINNGDPFSNSTSVTLNLSASDPGSGVAEMRFSNDGINWSTWEPYSGSKTWTLSAGDGSKNVYVQFKDNAGNISEAYIDDIVIDTTPPTGSIVINSGATYTNNISASLTLSASDSDSGVSQMRFSNNSGGPWSLAEPYSSTRANWNLSQYGGDSKAGYKTVFVQYRDSAGNWSDSFSTSIYYQPLQAFFDDFSTDKGWVGFEPGGWERGLAVAGGGENGYPDPGEGYSPSEDNYILGFAIGADYPNNLIEEKSIISPPIDCTGQNQVFLKFRRYLNVEGAPPGPNADGAHARIYASTNGTDWTQVWENPPIDTTDSRWVPFVLDISDIAANQAIVYIKFTMGPTNSSRRFSGWNIDNFELTSEAIYPSEGTMGTKLTITGSGFGTKKGKVSISSTPITPLTIIDWADGLIHCQLAKVLDPGVYDVVIQPSGPKGTPAITKSDGFAAKAPEIYSVHQTQGSAYDEVTIEGKHFGTKKGKVYLECGEGENLIRKNCKVNSWMMEPTSGDSEIVFVVPTMLPEVCDVVVDLYSTLEEVEEEDGFTVKAPEIVEVNPKSGSGGNYITIHGNFFGTKKGKVYLGYVVKGKPTKKSCSVVSWAVDPVTEEGDIVFVVPNGLPLGAYNIIVTNNVGSDALVSGFTVK
jgi:hypothetical protein